ncbi:MAG: hypothetical protein MJ252_27015 [archaeon]|nr:hypothetical protein [archaeon]
MNKLNQNEIGVPTCTKTTLYSTAPNMDYIDRRKKPIRKRQHDFNCQRKDDPPLWHQITQLTGHFKKSFPPKYPNQRSTNEVKYTHKRKFSDEETHSMTKRTMDPYLNTEPSKPNRPFSRCNKESKPFSYISRVDNHLPLKKTNPRLYESHCFDHPGTEESKEDYSERQNTLRSTPFSDYSKTTQIYHLPGGVKRNQNEINDDKKERRLNKRSKSFQIKTEYDHKSNISCIPGCKLNPIRHIFRRYSGRKNINSAVRNVEREEEIEKSLRNRNKTSNTKNKDFPSGCYNTKESNFGKGKKFINLSGWKKNYYMKMGKVFTHVVPGDGRVTSRVPYGEYKNKSQFKFK